MTTLTKEEVIGQLQMALEKQSGQAVSIEQAGSWYKIDGGKSQCALANLNPCMHN